MKILITGACGFAGATLAECLLGFQPELDILGVDNFMRAGSETNRSKLRALGVRVQHADLRNSEDLTALPPVDFVLDAAANPSVLAGVGTGGSSRSLMDHNLVGTINILEYCKVHRAGLILLSTSRVYSIEPLAKLALEVERDAFRPNEKASFPRGMSPAGVTEEFSTGAPISLYGATKICAESLALEYALTFGFPVWINRLGVLAGAGQFGKADQGIFSFWIHSCARRKPLKFIGFGGHGYQVRDCLHPRDLAPILLHQMKNAPAPGQWVCNFSGGTKNSMSLRQLHTWCEARFGATAVERVADDRPFDLPWLVLDSDFANQAYNWRPETSILKVLEEIALHAEENPHWLECTTT